ncbi:MAG: hypothetical protein ABI548_11575 [Polyangiaceae bacterium]
MRANFLSAAGVLLILAPTTRAFAQTDLERAAARDAADTGRTQFEAGRYAEAIDSFSRAQQLVAAPPHLLFLARAQAKLGKLVEAHENYLKITRETLPPKSPKVFIEAQSAAERELDALEARLPSVTIAVQGAPAGGVSVQMDGATLSSAMVGIPLPVDPGQHVFAARGASAQSAPVTVTVAEGAKETVMLTLRPSTPSAAAAHKPGASTSADLTSEPLADDTGHSNGSGLRVGSYVAFGVGAVGLGLGAYFLVKSSSTRSSSNALYDSYSCNATGSCTAAQQAAYFGKVDDANSQRNLGVGALVVGGVGVVTGITLLILSSGQGTATAQNNAPHLTPLVGFRSLGLAGTF